MTPLQCRGVDCSHLRLYLFHTEVSLSSHDKEEICQRKLVSPPRRKGFTRKRAGKIRHENPPFFFRAIADDYVYMLIVKILLIDNFSNSFHVIRII